MPKGKLTKEQEFNKYKSAFNYGQQSIHPLSNKELIKKKKIIETYIDENNKAYEQINRINSKKRNSEDDKMSLAYWKERLDLHQSLGTNKKAFITIEKIDENGQDNDNRDHSRR